MILGICGSRTWTNREAIRACLSHLKPGDVVVSGGANGADSIGEDVAAKMELEVISFRPAPRDLLYVIELHVHSGGKWAQIKPQPPNVVLLSRAPSDAVQRALHEWVWAGTDHAYPTFASAAFTRNGMIARTAERGCAFRMPGKSNGTDHCVKEFVKSGKVIKVFHGEKP